MWTLLMLGWFFLPVYTACGVSINIRAAKVQKYDLKLIFCNILLVMNNCAYLCVRAHFMYVCVWV